MYIYGAFVFARRVLKHRLPARAVAGQQLVSLLRLRVEQPAVSSGNRPALTVRPSAEPAPPLKRGAWEIMAAGSGKTTVVELAVARAL